MSSAGVVDAAGPPRSGDTGTSRAAVILGNDAILAAQPSTTAQLAHACWAAGFDIIVPPSWGDELVARAELQRRLVERVLALREPSRSTVLLCYFEGLAPSEAARAMGVPAATMRSRLKRALDELRAQFDAEQREGREVTTRGLGPPLRRSPFLAILGRAAPR